MAKSGKQVRAKRYARNQMTEIRRNRSLDALAEFEVFDTTILPQLKKMVLENWSPDKIRKAFAPIMQAVMIKKGLEGNFKAVKDTLDRHEGTAVQRVEQSTYISKMSKPELAALVLQRLFDARVIDAQGRVIKVVKDDDDK